MSSPAPTTAPAEAAPSALPQDRASKIKRLAALFIVLGPEIASEILKTFDPRETKEISSEMAKIEMVDFKTQQALLEEFSDLAVQSATSVTGGFNFTRQVLEKSMSGFQASDIIRTVSPARSGSIDTTILQNFDSKSLFSLLKNENPQTMAFVLSYMDPIKCGEVLTLLNADLRADVVERIASMESIPTDVLARVLDNLKKHINLERPASSKSGGLASIAEAIKSMDNAISKTIITALDEKNPELSGSLKKILFSFEDLKGLDTASLQKVLREVESKDLAMAMKTASEALQKMIYGALPKRAGDSIRDEIKFMPPMRVREIEAAQERVIEAMRKLESQGEITIGGGGQAEMMV